MPKLEWISDDKLLNEVDKLLKIARKAKEKAMDNFGKNVVDPFSAIFEMAGFNLDFDEWAKTEAARQAQKTLQNFVGEFHQNILGASDGWADLKKGKIIDLVNSEKKIIAEVKNKFNTISGGSLARLYWTLEPSVMNKTSIYKGYTAYYVTIIPSNPIRFDTEFTPSDKEKGQKCPPNQLIRQIDGASFYSLVTGVDNALEMLFEALPAVIVEVTGANEVDGSKLKKLFELAYG